MPALSNLILPRPPSPVRIAAQTLLVDSAIISFVNLPIMSFYQIRWVLLNNGLLQPALRFNNDQAANYSRRNNVNGGADTTTANLTAATLSETAAAVPWQGHAFIDNLLNAEKFVNWHSDNKTTPGPGSSPNRREGVSVWDTVTDRINRIDVVNLSTGLFADGSTVLIEGSR